MPETNSYETIVAILASIALFVCVAIVLVTFVLYFQKKKFQQKQQLLEIDKENQQQLVETKLEVEEQTRLYIAREIHDNISTLASLVKINLGLISTANDTQKKETYLTETQSLVKTLISDLKHLSVNLNSDRISSMPLSQALEEELNRIRKLELFKISFSVEGEETMLHPDRQLIVFRICQELLHNIVKHAKASEVTVQLSFTAATLSLEITDNGCGFDTAAANTDRKELGGAGIINLHKRINLVGGSLYLDSTPGSGTRCLIQIPSPA